MQQLLLLPYICKKQYGGIFSRYYMKHFCSAGRKLTQSYLTVLFPCYLLYQVQWLSSSNPFQAHAGCGVACETYPLAQGRYEQQ